MAIENKHWAKEIVQRTKKRDDIVNNRFIGNEINQLSLTVAQASASISDLKTQLLTYWSQVPLYKGPRSAMDAMAQGTLTSSTTEFIASKIVCISLAPDRIREKAEQLEKVILKYLYHFTEHFKKMTENRIRSAKAQMAEFKALEDFQLASTPPHWNIHLILKSKMKSWSTKNKNRTILLKCIELELPAKWIPKIASSCKADESMISQQEV
ncbi:unnamed protein product [Rotaria magnacalcarata]|uniref:Uncharacterized protein n=1 Tax=Rotaria magnacalcarata TaxID=392030 RepID=A0A816AZM6_9BILA|nr:unnamed protein product [Rotaria magnacalcarata]CAF1616207.1 unnamed protein product [Rotaria magnacalcarata]CAF2130885.1 unnamed protein product [Rotaria magnacalcarata]CAF3837589.1 unnamed protein product [Rotaria magnacalcarata]CAF4854041.1 unnamed protein product [Rotaria magnacalcarata]